MKINGRMRLFLVLLMALVLIPTISVAADNRTITVNENEEFVKEFKISDESGILESHTKIMEWNDAWGSYEIKYSEELIKGHPKEVTVKLNVNLNREFNEETFTIKSKDGVWNESTFNLFGK